MGRVHEPRAVEAHEAVPGPTSVVQQTHQELSADSRSSCARPHVQALGLAYRWADRPQADPADNAFRVLCEQQTALGRREGSQGGEPLPEHLEAKFWRVAGPRANGKRKKKAAVAAGHKILIAAHYIMSTDGEVYRDLGGDYSPAATTPNGAATGSSPSSPSSVTTSL